MLPEGAKRFAGKINQEVARHVRAARRVRHRTAGRTTAWAWSRMIVVGMPANELEAKPAGAQTHPGRARQVFVNLFGRLEATRTAAK